MVLVFVVYIIVVIFINLFISRFMLDNQLLEFFWTVFPMLILLLLAFPSLRILYIMDEIKNPLLTFKVIGHQWFWSYEYSDFKLLEFDSYIVDGNFRLLETDNSFYVPFNQKIRLLVRSFDVLHSWTVPILGVKVDAIPGRLNQLNFIFMRLGLFFGQCSEICGVNHRFIPIIVECVKLDDFFFWLKNYSLKNFK